jgi:hypothetical protein
MDEIMAGPIPNLQFNPYNPMQTALEAALGTYKGIGQGRGQQIQNQMQGARVPYAGQMAQEELLAQQLQNQLQGFGVQQKQAESPYYGQMAAIAPRAAEADIIHKQAIGKSALLNSEIARLNYQMQMARNPVELAKLDAERRQIELEAQGLQEWMNRNGMSGQRSAGMGAQTNYPNSGINNQISSNLPVSPLVEQNTPDMYLPPEKQFNPAESYINRFGEKYMSQVDLAGQKARSEELAKGQVRMYDKTMEKLGESAAIASEENSILNAMGELYLSVPDWQKGNIMGELRAISGESKVFEALKSGLVLDELQQQTGTQSEGDRVEIKNMFPGRNIDQKNMAKLLTIRNITNDRRIARQNFYANHPKVPTPQLDKAWNEWLKNNSIFSDPKYIKYKEEEMLRDPLERARLKQRLLEKAAL